MIIYMTFDDIKRRSDQQPFISSTDLRNAIKSCNCVTSKMQLPHSPIDKLCKNM